MGLIIKNVVSSGLVLLLSVAQINARQIRINRFGSEIENDSSGDIEVKVTRLQPVPNTGLRSERAYNISGSRNSSTETDLQALQDALTTTTSYALDWSTTTAGYDDHVGESTMQPSVNVGKTPYPAAGYRPSRAFLLPTENQVNEGKIIAAEDDLSAMRTTTSSNNLDSTTNTLEGSITTESSGITVTATDSDFAVTTELTNTSPPAVTTSSPIVSKTPYPLASYRPSRAFLLPYEVPLQSNPDPTVAQHPVCGVSDFPLRPKPAPGAKEEPDAERVPVTAAVGPAVVAAPVPDVLAINTRPVLEVRTQRLVTQPIFIARRPRVYSAPVPEW